MKFENMVDAGKKFVGENKDLLIKIGVAAAVGILYKKCGITYDIFNPLGITPGTTRSAKILELPLYANNKEEAAILSIYKTAKTMSWDSDKIRSARDIFNIATKSKEDSTKRFAIEILSNLAETISWDSDKRRVSDMIRMLGGA